MQEGVVDMLVHCLKDVPTSLPPGCEIAGVLERADPLDCLVVKKDAPWKSLEELPDGSVVGTSSVRRVAQLKRRFPKLVFKDVVRRPAFPICLLAITATARARSARELVSAYMPRSHAVRKLNGP